MLENYILAFIGIAITALLAVIGYFLKQQNAVLTTLTSTVNALTTAVTVLEAKSDLGTSSCVLKHGNIDARFTSHSERIKENKRNIESLDISVAIIKEKIK